MALLGMVVEVSYQQSLAVIVILQALCAHSTEIIKYFFLSWCDRSPCLSIKYILVVSNNSK